MKKILNLCYIILLLTLIPGCGKKLSCEDGYILKEQSCYKEIEAKVATEVYTCEDGYLLNVNNNKCEKIETIDATTKYTCNNGYTLNGDKCSGVFTINATPSYSCLNGGTLNGAYCVQRVADLDALICTKYCVSGNYDSSLGKCVSIAPFTGNKTYHNPVCKYTCARGTMVGSMCYSDVATQAHVTYSCQNGYTLNGNKCSKNISVAANTTYTCEDGYTLKNNQCQKTLETNHIINYTCEENYELQENQCILYDVKEAVEK